MGNNQHQRGSSAGSAASVTKASEPLTVADRGRAIRAELKSHGITARQVSVRTTTAAWSETIYVEIKDVTVSRSLVEGIARPHAHQRVDERGHNLMGANRYVEIRGVRGGAN